MPVLFTFNLQPKFEMSSFIRYEDMAWVPQCINESRDPDHAHLGDSQAHRHRIYKYLDSLLASQTARKAKPPTTDIRGQRKMADWPSYN